MPIRLTTASSRRDNGSGALMNQIVRRGRILRGRWRGYRIGATLLFAFYTGRVPIHAFRLFVYRRMLGIQIGRGSSVHWRTVFYRPERLTIGDHSIVGNDVMFDARRGITIGDNVNIGGHVQIFTLQHDADDPLFGTKGGEVVIEDRAWISSRATVLPGVRISEGAVVAAGAVVVRDVAPYTVVGGVPARYLRDRSRGLDYTLNFHLPFQ